jgi:hypothetical protein
MKLITIKHLEKYHACTGPNSGTEWFLQHFSEGGTPSDCLEAAIKAGRFDDANWLLARILTTDNKIRYAIFAGELVLDNYEKLYPGDDRLRKCYAAAHAVLENNNVETRAAARAARAASATYSAASAARAAESAARAASAAWAAESAARAAESAAWAAEAASESAWAAWSAARAAESAAWAAEAAAESAGAATFEKILRYGLTLLK